VTIVFGAIAPHGDPAFVAESPTRLALEELGSRLEHAVPDVTVVVTPHNVHVEGAFAVITAATIAGSLQEQPLDLDAARDASPPALSAAVDVALAAEVLASLRRAGIPAARVSFGSNDETLAVMPMDWGTLIPLWFLGGRDESRRPVVVLSPARDLPLAAHVRAGRALADACAGRRAAVVAAEYDERVVELVRANRLGDALALESIVEAASADSLWQLAVLAGALGDGFRAELLSYERPTYFGMLCAAFEPAA